MDPFQSIINTTTTHDVGYYAIQQSKPVYIMCSHQPLEFLISMSPTTQSTTLSTHRYVVGLNNDN
jgi:hypothetical protein